MSLKCTKEGVKGPLSIVAEIFQLTPTLRVVEMKKKGGDRGEYEDFCRNECLKNILPDEYIDALVVSLLLSVN
ncbi:CBL-interacting serine/threonine-protein kinase [Thalictrum thalictroides]|uniref:CBL-interacting serine/threonine-protein kinase n=1 Tax=Thalictrum thalictroides TaxID=46969 RepID=A0A7J6V9S4_THATH|nr:CBL-interacting serine/threonine-protein kinase [Thalictrum thalictroides]